MSFETLKGKTISAIHGLEVGGERVRFETSDGKSYVMYHSQDCCESVEIEDIAGDVADLIGSEVLLAEEVTSDKLDAELQAKRDAEKAAEEAKGGYYYGPESEMWTFYKLSTILGSVTIRWYGTSNGYYSEGVSFEEESAA